MDDRTAPSDPRCLRCDKPRSAHNFFGEWGYLCHNGSGTFRSAPATPTPDTDYSGATYEPADRDGIVQVDPADFAPASTPANEGVEGLVRIAAWNALRERGVDQGKRYPIIEKVVAGLQPSIQALSTLDGTQSAGEGVEELRTLVAPWADHHGPLPEYDHPLACVFDSGVQHAVELLAKELDVDDWTPCDGTEEYDGDLGGTLMNIVLAAMPKDRHGDPLHPREVRQALSTQSAEPVVPLGEHMAPASEALDYWTEAYGGAEKFAAFLIDVSGTAQNVDAARRELERAGHAINALLALVARTPAEPVGDELVERLKEAEGGLSHADAMALQPSTPSEVETTQISTAESKIVQRALRDAAERIASLTASLRWSNRSLADARQTIDTLYLAKQAAEAREKGLREALKPFAVAWVEALPWSDFDGRDCRDTYLANAVNLSDFEAARTALANNPEPAGEER